jgi:tRNA threonylcarbamoyl adenosine modification protein YjeE
MTQENTNISISIDDLDSHINNFWFDTLEKKILSNFKKIKKPYVIYLNGDLGAGKTTWTRSLLRMLGVTGTVKSPTFNYVIEYEIFKQIIEFVYHFDLYRLESIDANSFFELGLDEPFSNGLDKPALCIIEWADKGKGVLPKADLIIDFGLNLNDESSRFISYKFC